MIRFIHCMKRRPELSVAEFREYWNSPEFSEQTNLISGLLDPVSVIRNLTFNIEVNTTLMQQRGAEEAYDGIIEMWLEDASALKKLDTDEFKKIEADSKAFQEKFVDFQGSKRFFTEWAPVSGLD